MNRLRQALGAVLLVGTGVHGLVWMTLLLVAQGLERAEKILSAVTLPPTIVIGSGGLRPTHTARRTPPGAAGPLLLSCGHARPARPVPAGRAWDAATTRTR